MTKSEKFRALAKKQVDSWSNGLYKLFKGEPTVAYNTTTGVTTYPATEELSLPVAIYDVEETIKDGTTAMLKKGVIAGVDLVAVELDKGDSLVSSDGDTYVITNFNTDQYKAAYMLDVSLKQ